MPSCSRLRYLESHPRTSGSWPSDRPPLGVLVLLHAFPIGARMWEPQQTLADSGWHVVMPQFRGFDCARPDGTAVESTDDYARDVADLLQTLAIDRAVIGGLSMGGYVALALYRRAPDRFRGLVLADTRADADSLEARANRARLIALAASGGTPAIADDMAPRLLGATTRAAHPQVEARLRSLIAANQPGAIVAALRAMMTREDSTALLRSITVPTLVIVGEEDSLTPPPLGASMAALIPGAECIVMAKAGHLPNLERPEAFNATLLTFLGRLSD